MSDPINWSEYHKHWPNRFAAAIVLILVAAYLAGAFNETVLGVQINGKSWQLGGSQ